MKVSGRFVVLGGDVARPSSYTPTTVDAVIAAKAAGKSDADAAKAAGISPWTLYHWLKTKTDFRDLYDHACALCEAEKMQARGRLTVGRIEKQLEALRERFPQASAAAA
jgi:hypothetical protein